MTQPGPTVLYESDQNEIRDLLMGHKVIKVSDDTLELDNGTRLTLEGHEGGCSCSAGDYYLTELNGVDNVITSVEFADDPDDDDYYDATGTYQIFVYADNVKVNLARFEGSDGNGYYGTGYRITVSCGAY